MSNNRDGNSGENHVVLVVMYVLVEYIVHSGIICSISQSHTKAKLPSCSPSYFRKDIMLTITNKEALANGALTSTHWCSPVTMQRHE